MSVVAARMSGTGSVGLLRRAVQDNRFISAYSSASKAWPLTIAFGTCWLKGSASDAVTQKVIEKKQHIDWRRNIAFATFSGAYLGCGQHVIYNILFTRWFGTAQTIAVSARKVLMDAFWHVPMLYLPLYYAFEDTILREGPLSGLRRYSEEWLDCMKPYWCIFSGFHFCNFILTPPELRIAAIAGVSFIWLIVLSYVSHKAYEQEKIHKEDHVHDVEENFSVNGLLVAEA
eukprot:TRINITY_DN16611_c0_g2_i1.p1 TRINITY_DN16611_c0_g2~~TRINITY_DN16611_c0_g2_i1.p1  ORF type:complete len:230 (-),score=51.19 TRINITY_DN16611_c0_g2_i1:418-1107(-)